MRDEDKGFTMRQQIIIWGLVAAVVGVLDYIGVLDPIFNEFLSLMWPG